jgi:hypothetical protein
MAWFNDLTLSCGAGSHASRVSTKSRKELFTQLASMIKLLNDAQHWRDRAEEARVIASSMHDETARRQMFAIAEGYQRLAERAEERTNSNQPAD